MGQTESDDDEDHPEPQPEVPRSVTIYFFKGTKVWVWGQIEDIQKTGFGKAAMTLSSPTVVTFQKIPHYTNYFLSRRKWDDQACAFLNAQEVFFSSSLALTITEPGRYQFKIIKRQNNHLKGTFVLTIENINKCPTSDL